MVGILSYPLAHYRVVICEKGIIVFLSTVYADGSICLDILQNRWSPTYDVSSILTSIQVGNVNKKEILKVQLHLILHFGFIYTTSDTNTLSPQYKTLKSKLYPQHWEAVTKEVNPTQ